MGKLTTSISDPDQLAMYLFSSDIITTRELDGIMESEHGSAQKTRNLIRLVLDKIEWRPEVFHDFTEVLREANMSSSAKIFQGWTVVLAMSSCFPYKSLLAFKPIVHCILFCYVNVCV